MSAQELPMWLRLTEPDSEAVNELESALARLRKDGWTRGKFHDIESGKRCALGAFGGAFPADSPATPYLAYAIRTRRGGHRYGPEWSDLQVIIRFNDTQRRRFSDVEAVFLDAIAYAKGEGVHARA